MGTAIIIAVLSLIAIIVGTELRVRSLWVRPEELLAVQNCSYVVRKRGISSVIQGVEDAFRSPIINESMLLSIVDNVLTALSGYELHGQKQEFKYHLCVILYDKYRDKTLDVIRKSLYSRELSRSFMEYHKDEMDIDFSILNINYDE